MSTCHKPNGRNICFYPITHWGYSDGGGVLDQNREKKQEQVIKNIISQLQATPETYKRLDLLSQLRPLLKPPSGNQHLTRLLNSSSNSTSRHNTHPSVGYACHCLPHHTEPVPYPQPGCHRATIPPLPNRKLHNSLGQSLTMSYSQPLQT